MDKSLVKAAAVVILGSAAYYGASSVALPWAPLLASSPVSYLSLQLANTAVLMALSLPFAVLLTASLLELRSPILASAAIALLGLVAPVIAGLPLVLQPWPAGASVALDLAKFATVLPLLTWAATRWLPSNNSFKPTPLRGAA